METLIKGYNEFHRTMYTRHKKLYKRLAEGQSPKDMVIACCDSRVEPALIFNTRPGDIFVLRNIANLVPPYAPDGHTHATSAALEFAVKRLKVRSVVVMGHSGCGGVRALLDDKQGEFIGPWMQIAEEAGQRALEIEQEVGREAALLQCEYDSILISLRNLHTYPWISQAMQEYGLKLQGLYFDIEEARLYAADEKTGHFSEVGQTAQAS